MYSLAWNIKLQIVFAYLSNICFTAEKIIPVSRQAVE